MCDATRRDHEIADDLSVIWALWTLANAEPVMVSPTVIAEVANMTPERVAASTRRLEAAGLLVTTSDPCEPS